MSGGGLYNHNFSPARALSPQIRTTQDVESSQYLSELLAEHQKLGPFLQVLPICSRLLNQEILRVSGMMPNQGFNELDRMRHRSPSPMASSNLMSNVAGTGMRGWNGLPQESFILICSLRRDFSMLMLLVLGHTVSSENPKQANSSEGWKVTQRLSGPPGMSMDWQGAPASPSSYTVKRILRLEIPVDTYPNEEKLRGRPGYEHLNEPLHILIEGDLPASIVDMKLRQAQEIIEELLKPVDESEDYIKRQQLRELALLNSNFREESPGPSGGGSVSPFNTSGMKRAKTGR
ncbi:hypothetical protein LguiA_031994 [Lonicera macranthoides]